MNNSDGSRFSNKGFILAAIGSAVGLGNIWKFPYMAGENGGGVFVLVYLICIILIGFSVFMCELIIGKNGRNNVAENFAILAPPKYKKFWKIGGISIITAIIICSYYTVVISWIMYYIYDFLVGHATSNLTVAKSAFNNLINHKQLTLVFNQVLQFVALSFIMIAGVKGGIEKVNKILIPALIAILLFIMFYSMTLSGFSKSLNFLFSFKYDNFTTKSLVESIGHSFFTLSLGTSAIIAYATSINENASIAKTTFYVVLVDTLIALIAGIGIFAIIFTAGGNPEGGPGLVFISFPTVLTSFGSFGIFIGLLFFIALFFAGFSSAISLLEPAIEYIQSKDISRVKAIIIINILCFILSCFVIYYNKLFNILNFATSNVMIPILGLLGAIFVAYVVKKDILENDVRNNIGVIGFKIWLFTIRYIVPIAFIIVILDLLNLVKY